MISVVCVRSGVPGLRLAYASSHPPPGAPARAGVQSRARSPHF